VPVAQYAQETITRPREAAPRAACANRLLALQRTAGNRAVGAYLARAPKAKAKPKPAPRNELAERRISHMVVTGLALPAAPMNHSSRRSP
jgi:hypothetical protein